MIENNQEIQWKVWRISKSGGGRHGNAHKGDVWECSNIGGLVRKNGVILETIANTEGIMNGYLCLKDSGYRVHRIIAETWVPNPEGKKYVDHIDTNKCNNDASNLRWVTASENILNRLTIKKISEGKKRYGKLKQEHKDNIRIASRESYNKMTEKQKRIRSNSHIKGIYLRLNKETSAYEYYDSRYHGNKMTEDKVNEILLSYGYDDNAIKIQG